MSASLLAELSAIESMMMKRAAQKRVPVVVAQSMDLQEQAEDSPAGAAPLPVAKMDVDTEVEKEHTCAICLVCLSP